VCDDIAAQIRRRLALKQRGKPVGVFILAGPPGTGKTYLPNASRPNCNARCFILT
jgi:ATP-dependent Clp protease ATP-binding subunit ClpA